MNDFFKTFKPIDINLSKFIDYYYIDFKPNNKYTEYDCFPHYNNTISIYKNHIRLNDGSMKFEENASPFQIFTPVHENVLKVKQIGKLIRIVIVFKPFGINQFFKKLDFSNFNYDFSFFSKNEIDQLFDLIEINSIAVKLDKLFLSRLEIIENTVITDGLNYIFKRNNLFSVNEMAEVLDVSRRHLSRIFVKEIGVSVKKFHEIVLFRQTMEKKLFQNPNISFTELAYCFNLSDQSHFNKIYKKLSKSAPKNFYKKGKVVGEQDIFWHIY